MELTKIAVFNDTEEQYKIPEFHEDYYALRNLNFRRKERELYLLKDCYISFNLNKNYRYELYIYNSKKELVPELCIGNDPELYETVSRELKSVAFIDDFFNIFNVCHTLLDKFPRVLEFKNLNIEKFLLLRKNDYIDSIASLLDISLLNIHNGRKTFSIRVDSLYLSSSSFRKKSFIHPGQNMYRHTNDFIDFILRNAPKVSNGPKRIYIDRSKGNKRNVVNSDEVKNFMEENNFDLVRLEEFSFIEQVNLFRNAQVVIGLHGAGLTNIAFCAKGTNVLEVFPPLCATPAFAKLAISRGLQYSNIVGLDTEFDIPNYDNWEHNGKDYNRRDVIIPIDKMKNYLESIKE